MGEMGDMYWRFAGALILVVAMIFAAAWVAKRLGLGGGIARNRGKRRLAIEEVLSLDGKRRLVLIKRDGVEHLLLIGLNDDLVVEAGIVPPQGASASEFASMLPGSHA
jgi:flagellar protein FliO/FliZ